jgi:hypothetical protein
MDKPEKTRVILRDIEHNEIFIFDDFGYPYLPSIVIDGDVNDFARQRGLDPNGNRRQLSNEENSAIVVDGTRNANDLPEYGKYMDIVEARNFLDTVSDSDQAPLVTQLINS